MSTATRTAGEDDRVGDEDDEEDTWVAIDDTVTSCSDGVGSLPEKGLRKREGRD